MQQGEMAEVGWGGTTPSAPLRKEQGQGAGLLSGDTCPQNPGTKHAVRGQTQPTQEACVKKD
jgi:hypothetical protein